MAENKKTGGQKKTAVRKNAKNTNSARNLKNSLKPEIICIIIIAVCILVIISVFSGNGASGDFSENAIGFAGGAICRLLKGLFGIGAYVLPFAVIMFCGAVFFADDNKVKISKLIMSVVLFLILISFMHLIGNNAEKDLAVCFDNGGPLNGGAVGSIIGDALYGVIGFGSYILFVVTGIILAVCITGKSFMAFSKDIFYRVYDSFDNDEDDDEDDEYEEDFDDEEDFIEEDKIVDEKKNPKKEKKWNVKSKKDKISRESNIKKLENERVTKYNGKIITIDIVRNDEREDKPKISLFTDEMGKGGNNVKNNNMPSFLRDGTVKAKGESTPKDETKNEIIFNGIDKVNESFSEQEEYYEANIREEIGKSDEQKMFREKDAIREFAGSAEVKETKRHEEIFQTEETETVRERRVEEQKTFGQGDVKSVGAERNLKEDEPIIIQAEKQVFVSEAVNQKKDENREYEFPKLSFLGKNPVVQTQSSREEVLENSKILINTLKSFNIEAKVNEISKGPTVTRYEISPGEGIKVSKILGLADNLALSLAAQSIRIEAPIPGKAAVGIEIPNKEVLSVYLSEVVCDSVFQKFPSKLSFGLGKDIAGNVIVTDIAKMPHMLIAGSTGSGKSVCINTLITSILYKAKPDEVKLIMVDPKVVELSVYNGIPHLLIPVVTDPQQAAGALNWAVAEMMNRYDLFAQTGVRNLKGYNEYREEQGEEKLPQIVIIIDELADLMMVASKEVEAAICRLAQLARAAGLHLIIATQRPSVDVITGLIKANIPSRIAFAVSSTTDSRTILDTGGAEKLLGKGDMLFKAVDMNKPLRIQGAFVTDKEVETIVSFIKERNPVSYDEDLIEKITSSGEGGKSNSSSSSDGSDDLTDEAIDFVVKKGSASISMLQRRFKIGYNRAARIIDELEDRGIVGADTGTSKPRSVLMDKYEWQEYSNRRSDYI